MLAEEGRRSEGVSFKRRKYCEALRLTFGGRGGGRLRDVLPGAGQSGGRATDGREFVLGRIVAPRLAVL
jgi:hypothetical protein